MIWLVLWVVAILAMYASLAIDTLTGPIEAMLATFLFGGVIGGLALFGLPHMFSALISSQPVYEKTVDLQEVNGYYVTKNAEGYLIVYGDEYNFTSVQLDSTPPEPEEGCEKPQAKVYQMQNINKFWSIMPVYFNKQYVICVPDGEIKD